MKHCNQCNKSYPDDHKWCPLCAGELVDFSKVAESVSMGDGNAINGGVTISKDMSTQDDHSISSSHNTSNSHNKTTNIITEHIYNGPLPTKTTEELLRDRKLKFREYCKQVLADGLITRDEHLWLEEKRGILDLSKDVAERILKDVRNNNSYTSKMMMGQRVQLDNFKKAIHGNMVDSVRNQMPNIQVIASKIDNEELQYLNYMVLAALEPNEIIRLYAESVNLEDNYWLTYWTYVAYQKIGDRLKAENVVLELAKWNDCKPHEDIELVAILGHLILGEKEIASEIFVRTISGYSSPVLSDLSDVISVILFYDIDDVNKNKLLTQNKFYIEHFLKEFSQLEIDAARVAKENILAQKKAEELALVQAEKTIKEAEEQMRQLAVERDKFTQEREQHHREREEYIKALEEQKDKLKQESNLLKQERQSFEIESRRKDAELKEKEEKLLAVHNANIEKQVVLEQQAKSAADKKLKIDDEIKLLANERDKFNREKEMAQRELGNKEATLKAEKEAIDKERQQYEDISHDVASWESKKQLLQNTCTELETRKNELQQLVNKLEQFKKQHCITCGAIASPDAVYCRICGTKLSNK